MILVELYLMGYAMVFFDILLVIGVCVLITAAMMHAFYSEGE